MHTRTSTNPLEYFLFIHKQQRWDGCARLRFQITDLIFHQFQWPNQPAPWSIAAIARWFEKKKEPQRPFTMIAYGDVCLFLSSSFLLSVSVVLGVFFFAQFAHTSRNNDEPCRLSTRNNFFCSLFADKETHTVCYYIEISVFFLLPFDNGFTFVVNKCLYRFTTP